MESAPAQYCRPSPQFPPPCSEDPTGQADQDRCHRLSYCNALHLFRRLVGRRLWLCCSDSLEIRFEEWLQRRMQLAFATKHAVNNRSVRRDRVYVQNPRKKLRRHPLARQLAQMRRTRRGIELSRFLRPGWASYSLPSTALLHARQPPRQLPRPTLTTKLSAPQMPNIAAPRQGARAHPAERPLLPQTMSCPLFTRKPLLNVPLAA